VPYERSDLTNIYTGTNIVPIFSKYLNPSLSRYLPQQNYKIGHNGLRKQIATTYFVAVVDAMKSGLRQSQHPVRFVGARIYNLYCAGNFPMDEDNYCQPFFTLDFLNHSDYID
jgi:hypothetical protein